MGLYVKAAPISAFDIISNIYRAVNFKLSPWGNGRAVMPKSTVYILAVSTFSLNQS